MPCSVPRIPTSTMKTQKFDLGTPRRHFLRFTFKPASWNLCSTEQRQVAKTSGAQNSCLFKADVEKTVDNNLLHTSTQNMNVF